MNKCIFIGNLTADVELRYTQDQLAVGTFSIAVNDGYGDKQRTSFFRCSIFGKRAEALQKYTHKGMKIAIVSRATQDQWTDREGNKRSAIQFLVDDWEFVQPKGTGEPTEQTAADLAGDPSPVGDGFMSLADDIDDLNLPFN